MIIFYNKTTHEIYGVVDGRVHSEDVLNKALIKPAAIPDSEVGKLVVPFIPIKVEEEVPVKELRVTDCVGRVKEVIVGKKKQWVTKGSKPDVPFSDLITDFENGKKRIYDYKVKLEKDKVIGFEEKHKDNKIVL
jgi:hypothetical protein